MTTEPSYILIDRDEEDFHRYVVVLADANGMDIDDPLFFDTHAAAAKYADGQAIFHCIPVRDNSAGASPFPPTDPQKEAASPPLNPPGQVCIHCGADAEYVVHVGEHFLCRNCEEHFTRADTLPRTDGLHYYTDAPENYDGFGTTTIEQTGWQTKDGLHRGKPIRLVNIPQSAAKNNWQLDRYGSGWYLRLNEREWNDHRDLWAEPIPATTK